MLVYVSELLYMNTCFTWYAFTHFTHMDANSLLFILTYNGVNSSGKLSLIALTSNKCLSWNWVKFVSFSIPLYFGLLVL